MRIRQFAALAALGLAFAACARQPATSDSAPRIEIVATAGGPWRLVYSGLPPTRRFDLGPTLDGFRARDWRLDTPGARLVSEEGRDAVLADRELEGFEFAVEPRPIAQADWPLKEYRPLAALGESGVLLYTGHFSGFRSGARLDAAYDFAAPEGWTVYAFGAGGPALKGWTSPYRQPAFVYIGPAEPAAGGGPAIVDLRAPGWTQEAALKLVPAVIAHFEASFARGLTADPDFFLAAGDLTRPGVLSVLGDALPGQFQATLDGDAWVEETDQARATLRRLIAHELAHLWQFLAPRADDLPDWILEGGADALAIEALAARGFISSEDRAAETSDAVAECARLTEGRSLAAAARAGQWRAVYACGHVLTEAAAGREGPAALWRDLIARAGPGGIDAALFYNLAAERAGAPAAEAIRKFETTNAARPELSLAEIFRLAGLQAPGAP